MRRRPFDFMATLSLLICGGLVVLWVRSFWVKDSVEFQRDGERWEIASEFGRLRLGNDPQLALDLAALTKVNKNFGRDGDLAAFFAERQRLLRKIKTAVPGPQGMPRPQLRVRRYELPHWPLVTAAAALPAAWGLAGVRHWQRTARGLCVQCGYDLRASPQRCPECGALRAVGRTPQEGLQDEKG